MTHTPAAYSDRLAIQARGIADRILGEAQQLRAEPADPNVPPAMLLATGPIAMEIYEGADCCVDDQLGLAVILAAELALRAAHSPGPVNPDRCDRSAGYHSTPHRGCILR